MIIISDIHGNLPALEAVLADAPEEHDIYCCGDFIGYGPWPNEIVRTAQDHDVVGVRGNHDAAAVQGNTFGFGGTAGTALRWTIDALRPDAMTFLKNLPYTRRETRTATDLYMVHGSPSAPTEEYVYPEAVTSAFFEEQGVKPDVLLLGHTHVPFTKTLDDTLVMNPGSIGQPRDGDPRASYAVLDLKDRTAEICRVPYDIDIVAHRVADAGLPSEIAERLRDGR